MLSCFFTHLAKRFATTVLRERTKSYGTKSRYRSWQSTYTIFRNLSFASNKWIKKLLNQAIVNFLDDWQNTRKMCYVWSCLSTGNLAQEQLITVSLSSSSIVLIRSLWSMRRGTDFSILVYPWQDFLLSSNSTNFGGVGCQNSNHTHVEELGSLCRNMKRAYAYTV